MSQLFTAILNTDVCPLMTDDAGNRLEVTAVNGSVARCTVLPADGGACDVERSIDWIDFALCCHVLRPVNFTF